MFFFPIPTCSSPRLTPKLLGSCLSSNFLCNPWRAPSYPLLHFSWLFSCIYVALASEGGSFTPRFTRTTALNQSLPILAPLQPTTRCLSTSADPVHIQLRDLDSHLSSHLHQQQLLVPRRVLTPPQIHNTSYPHFNKAWNPRPLQCSRRVKHQLLA